MNVHAAMLRQIEPISTQDFSVSDHHDDVGIKHRDLFPFFRGRELFGGMDRQPQFKRAFFHRGGLELQPSAHRFIGLGVNGEDLVA